MKTKIKIKLHAGSWTNDDVDITPTLKLCTGSKDGVSHKVKLTYIALCWLKWAVSLEFSKISLIKMPEHTCKFCGLVTTEPDENCYKAPWNIKPHEWV